MEIIKEVLQLWGLVSLVGLLVFCLVFGRTTYDFLRDEGLWDWPVWMYKLRRWWWLKGGTTAIDVAFIIAIMGLFWLGLIITQP
ncbi:hypothetical protein [Spirosoma sp.]|uniref:hypothetical protein n=1 Tax=Spirosoma sp. TaxID=1899569 RepID=UPI003B3A8293